MNRFVISGVVLALLSGTALAAEPAKPPAAAQPPVTATAWSEMAAAWQATQADEQRDQQRMLNALRGIQEAEQAAGHAVAMAEATHPVGPPKGFVKPMGHQPAGVTIKKVPEVGGR